MMTATWILSIVMQLHLLGTGGYHPSEDRHTACLMLPESGIVLDAGTSFFRVRDHLATDSLDIFLTHAHLDHVAGLTYLLDVLFGHDMSRVTVHAEASKLEGVKQHLFSQVLFPVDPPFDTRPLVEGDPVALPDRGTLSHFPLVHPGGTVGYRLDWPGKSMAYVTDTTASSDAQYMEHIRGVDVLIHECYFPDGFEARAKLTGHSCLSPVAQLARDADVGRLILVHVNPLASRDEVAALESAREIFAELDVGYDKMVVEF
ncbi:MAG: MBL fold metallo-hydrolase [Pirellulales bacterium]|nr:MBL fold metallo-hydrolase [Pirellulales bacterium]